MLIAALKAVCSLVIALPPKERAAQAELIPLIFKGLLGACEAGDDSHIRDILEVLMELVRVQPKFLRNELKSVVEAMTQIAASKSLESCMHPQHTSSEHRIATSFLTSRHVFFLFFFFLLLSCY